MTSGTSIKPLTVREGAPGASTTATTTRVAGNSSSTQVSNTKAPTQKLILSDELGKSIHASVTLMEASNSFEDFVRSSQGPSDLHEDVEHLDHPAAHLLAQYKEQGVPFETTTEQWSQERLSQALERGCHQSANLYKDFVRAEFVDFVDKKFWIVLPASSLEDLPDLRLSPLGVVPQHERRPRLICDYTYYNVNQETVPLAPPEAMQFGHALQRVLQRVANANPRFGPVYLSKIDISDGFYRMRLTLQSILPLGLILPRWEGEEQMIALPLVLPMGWTESPPSFSSATETIADLANDALRHNTVPTFHRLASLANTCPIDYTIPTAPVVSPPLLPRCFSNNPVRYVDVYVDDLAGLAQGPPSVQQEVNRAILSSLDLVFRPLSPDDLESRQEPASKRKLEKGDGFMALQKLYLGWLIDTQAMTLQLPLRRLVRLREILESLPRSRKQVSITTWHKVLGELRSMALGIPGSRGLFSALQFRFRHDKHKIRLTTMVHDFLDDFRWLFNDLQRRPTRIYEIVPTDPHIIGTTDASGVGMGGVFFRPTYDSTADAPKYESYLWRAPFPDSVRQQLVTFDNPKGIITNSDLELAATVAQNDVIAQRFGVDDATIANAHDNYAAVFWNRKGSTTTVGPAAYLLRLQSLHQRQYGYLSLHDFIPGHLNRMADDASRHLDWTDSEILTHFNTHFPQPATWNVCQLRPAMNSALISSLFRKRSDPASWLNERKPPTPIGTCGWSSVPSTPWILGSPKGTILYRTYKSSRIGSALDASHPVDTPFDLTQLLTSSEVWDRRTKGWGPLTLDSTNTETKTSDSRV